jgi:lysophospholipid acyltransferase (LPLAT)-like uncharacterized protein
MYITRAADGDTGAYILARFGLASVRPGVGSASRRPGTPYRVLIELIDL